MAKGRAASLLKIREDLDREESQGLLSPQKSVRPVVQPVKATGLLAPAAAQQQRAGMDAAQFLKAIQPNPYGRRSDVALKALGEFAGFGGDPMSADSRAAINDVIKGNQSGRYYANEGGVNYAPELSGSLTYNQQLLDSLNGYTFNPTSDTERTGYSITAPDGRSRVINWGTADSSFDKFMQTAIPIGLAALGGAALGGFIPGAEIGAAGGSGAAGAAANTAGGLIGAGEGAAQLAAYTAANPLTASQVVAATLPAGGLPGLGAATAGGLIGAGEGLAQLASYSAANPLTAAQVTASTLPAGGLPGLSSGLLAGVPAEALSSLEAYSAANPVTMAEVSAGIPEIGASVASSTPAVFNAAADSQLASSQLGITGAEAAAAATAPATVNLGSLGGTMGTAGGLSGALAAGTQIAKDALGPAAAFMKENPLLGRLLTSGAVSLLAGGAGGGSSGGSQSAAPSGPPVQWNSPLQQGLLAPVQQYAPPAITQNKPAGLLAQGYANDGAWRYLGG